MVRIGCILKSQTLAQLGWIFLSGTHGLRCRDHAFPSHMRDRLSEVFLAQGGVGRGWERKGDEESDACTLPGHSAR